MKDLVNKLDDRQLVAIVQDLTDPSIIKVIIDSPTDLEKLQILAQNMSNKQFAKLLNELRPKDLKAFQEKFREQVEQCNKQMANQDKMMKILEQIKKDMADVGQAPDFAIADNSNDSILFM